MTCNLWMDATYCPENIIVETKISDESGERNFQDLKRIGRMWYVPDGTMYVYYRPTHFRRKD